MRGLMVVSAVAIGVGVGFGLGCKDRAAEQQPSPAEPGPTMSATEIKRARDACQDYVDKVCRCAKTLPAMQQPCELAKAYPDALQVALDVAATPDSTRRDVRQSHGGVRNIVKTCIEELAKLPAAGCP